MNKSGPDAAVFDLALYLVCAARLALDENLGLASFRLIEGASRLLAAGHVLGVAEDPFLEETLATINEEKMRVMHDLDGYTAALDQLQTRFVEEAKRRNAAP